MQSLLSRAGLACWRTGCPRVHKGHLGLSPTPTPGAACYRLQPVKETRDKQVALWCTLILAYCQHTKVQCARVCTRLSVPGPHPWPPPMPWTTFSSAVHPHSLTCVQTFILDTQADSPLFVNQAINRKCKVVLGRRAGWAHWRHVHCAPCSTAPERCRPARSLCHQRCARPYGTTLRPRAGLRGDVYACTE